MFSYSKRVQIIANIHKSTCCNFHSEIRRVANSYNYDFWIGVSDAYSEGRWLFTNGQPANNLIFSWHYGEPNNDGDEDCVCVYGNKRLNDSGCHKTRGIQGVMCQFPNGMC